MIVFKEFKSLTFPVSLIAVVFLVDKIIMNESKQVFYFLDDGNDNCASGNRGRPFNLFV